MRPLRRLPREIEGHKYYGSNSPPHLTGRALWNCAQPNPENPERGNIAFCAGTGGLHSAEN